MNTIGNIIKDFNLPVRGRQLLATLPNPNFNQDCAKWMLENITEYRKRPLPTMPHDLEEYNRKRKEDYKYTVHSDFFKQPHVAEYMRISSAIDCANKSNEYWLRFMRDNISAEDKESHKKINEMLSTYGVERKYIPPELVKAQEIFGAGLSCPKEKDDPDSERWNY
jgi:hypothetical protein